MTASDSSVSSPDEILRLAYGFRATRALLSAVELDVFTALEDGPLDLQTLAGRTGVHQRGARDFFDALASLGLVTRDGDGRYANSADAGCYLVRGKPDYLGDLFTYLSGREYEFFGRLTPALRTGEPQSGTRGTGNYPAFYSDPAALDLFVRGMTGSALPVAKALAEKFPWRNFGTVIDIGTAEGCVPATIALAHPHIRGGGFDLAPIRPSFERYVDARGLSERLRFYAGDFFADDLPRCDVLVMGRIMHNWDLPTKTMLLRKAYDAIAPGGALIICEKMLDDDRRTATAGFLNSLYMLVMTSGGFEFTPKECAGWMSEIGFHDMRAEPLAADQWMLVGHK